MPPLAPPPVLTPDLLKSIREHPDLPPRTWYIIAATTLTILNRPDEIPRIYEHAATFGPRSTSSRPEQLTILRRMREALIKTSAVGGVPKIINSLLALKKVSPPDLQDRPSTQSPTERRNDFSDDPSRIEQRGRDFFGKVYGKVADRVLSQMDNSGTEDLGLVARLMYSHILSNTLVLSAADTSFVMIAALIPQDVNPQLKGHLKGAINGGATLEQVRAVRKVAIQICQGAGMTRLEDSGVAGWGWREDVASI
ncbi:uncharacterized protein K444DRAFT_606730 [Hyaloscypha bicolor E]|uniref:Carboxymuconolactone decarboxylase-like domain-containing protein n=1 Tax=Hyaloscypha bicolor E TaxID=1095630 RepID=A0A2J6TTW3_9HELO|nr:uncharacterized protein K444DRAFT_606730 [Hyaloscypha bicolor E]PMD66441.1 hypothetical protein K444DRAFT_606730 [Hyaloscypha bicolor E]